MDFFGNYFGRLFYLEDSNGFPLTSVAANGTMQVVKIPEPGSLVFMLAACASPI